MSKAYDAHVEGVSRTNGLLHRQGVDQTPLLLGRVRYKVLMPMFKFKSAVMLEIQERGIELVTKEDNKWWNILRFL